LVRLDSAREVLPQRLKAIAIPDLATEAVGSFALGGHAEPCPRLFWNSRSRPVAERFQDRVVDRLLGQVEVPELASETGDKPR